MSEISNYPDFYKSTEGQSKLGTEELIQTNQAFNELFDDLMLIDMEIVKRFESFNDRPVANLLKKIVVDGQKYTLNLEDKSQRDPKSETPDITWRDSEIIIRDISLQRSDGVYGREYWSYRLGADGIVRRWDGGDITAKTRNERELGIKEPKIRGNETLDELGKLALAGLQRTIDQIPNSRLEEDMGLNNQPVTLAEIQGLQDFLNRATDIQR